MVLLCNSKRLKMFVFFQTWDYSWSCPFAALIAEDILSNAFLSVGETSHRREHGLFVLLHKLETARAAQNTVVNPLALGVHAVLFCSLFATAVLLCLIGNRNCGQTVTQRFAGRIVLFSPLAWIFDGTKTKPIASEAFRPGRFCCCLEPLANVSAAPHPATQQPLCLQSNGRTPARPSVVGFLRSQR